MSATATPNLHDNNALLTYRVGPVLCCGSTLPIITITPPPTKLTHPPGTSTAEPGIFKHGSDIVHATDLRYHFGVKEEDWNQPGQIIITKDDKTTRGYFVDTIIDVIKFPDSGWGQLPPGLPRGIFSRTLLINKKIFLYADFSKFSQLQGSGYLAEYIAHLEKQIENTHKTETKKSTIKIPMPKENIPTLDTVKDKTNSEYQIKSKDTIQANNIQMKTDIKLDSISESKILSTSIINLANDNKPSIPEKEKNSIAPQIPKQEKEIKLEATRKSPTFTLTNKLKVTIASYNETESIKKEKLKTLGSSTKAESNHFKTDKHLINKTHINNNEDSGYFGLLLFLVLFVLATAGGYYYFSNENITPKESLKTTKQNSIREVIKTINESSTLNKKSPVKEIIVKSEITQQISTTKKKPSEYHASINKTDTTIIIELKGPQPPKIINNDPDNSLSLPGSVQVKEELIIKKTDHDFSTKNDTPPISNKNDDSQKAPTTVQNNDITEIVHIVVKGDTLWAIARYHLQNPFLYPELAKLSKIKNPDLIYPGNRVHIIFTIKKN